MMNYKALVGAVALAFAGTVANASTLDVSNTVRQAYKYHDSGHYKHDLAQVYKEAGEYLEKQAPLVKKPAIVMDVDETVISNWPEMAANQFAYFPDGPCDNLPKGPCGDKAWDAKGMAKVFPEAAAFIKKAQKLHVSVFFITGKWEQFRDVLSKNLRSQGVDGWTDLHMRPQDNHLPAVKYKVPVREAITAQGYTILENIGDQPTDLVGPDSGKPFLLPNPFYHVP